jgi:hypothetical protein
LTQGVRGTGLALYISRELIHRMDGRIGVESTAGGGATFRFELPRSATARNRLHVRNRRSTLFGLDAPNVHDPPMRKPGGSRRKLPALSSRLAPHAAVSCVETRLTAASHDSGRATG